MAGGTQAGKTTLLNCLAAAIPGRDRVVTCEEVFELRLPLRDVVSMQCRQPSLEGTGEIPLRRLVKEALRMRPSRIIVGEVRQAESLDLLIALNSGLPGMCTIHANSAREAVTKMCTLPLLAGAERDASFVVPTVATSVDLVVHIVLDRDGVRRVREIVALPGRVEGDVVEVADIFTTRHGRSSSGPTGFRRTSSGSAQRVSTWPACSPRSRPDGAMTRIVAGAAAGSRAVLRLVVALAREPAGAARAPHPGRASAWPTRSAQAGVRQRDGACAARDAASPRSCSPAAA